MKPLSRSVCMEILPLCTFNKNSRKNVSYDFLLRPSWVRSHSEEVQTHIGSFRALLSVNDGQVLSLPADGLDLAIATSRKAVLAADLVGKTDDGTEKNNFVVSAGIILWLDESRNRDAHLLAFDKGAFVFRTVLLQTANFHLSDSSKVFETCFQILGGLLADGKFIGQETPKLPEDTQPKG